MKKAAKILLAISLFFLSGCYPSDSTIQKGVDLLEQGEGEEGITYFLNLNEEYQLPLTEYLLGYAYYRVKQFPMALPLIDDSLRDNSLKDRFIGDKKFAEFLAFSAEGVDDRIFKAGLSELEKYRKAEGLSENDPEIISSLAFFHLRQESFEPAISFFRQLVGLAPTNEEKVSNLFFIAYIYEEKLNDYAKAQELLDEILALGENELAYQKECVIEEKVISQHLKKEELLVKYLRNLGELNKGKEDIALALEEFNKTSLELERLFLKLDEAGRKSSGSCTAILGADKLQELKTRFGSIRNERSLLPTTS